MGQAIRTQPALVGGARSEAPCLPEYGIGSGAGAERGIVFEHAVVGVVCHVEVAAAVEGNPTGGIQTVRAQPSVIGGARDEAATLPEYGIGSGVFCERGVVFEHAAVGFVGDIEIAAGV